MCAGNNLAADDKLKCECVVDDSGVKFNLLWLIDGSNTMYVQTVVFSFVSAAFVAQVDNDDFVDRYMELAEYEIVADVVDKCK